MQSFGLKSDVCCSDLVHKCLNKARVYSVQTSEGTFYLRCLLPALGNFSYF